ncbi:MAG TPA: hypothetical protein HA304_06265 [Methanosarcinales archaeon]|nr:hypothetical protein [Methanosarcinales archaeon]
MADGPIPHPGDDVLNHGLACYNLYETLDVRTMALGALEPQFRSAFCEAVGHTKWNRPDYVEPGSHQEALQKDIAALFKQKTR